MLTGYSLEEIEPFSLPEDEGEIKTVFYVRSIPRGKLDEFTAKAVDHRSAEKQDGAQIVLGKKFNREVVQWGIAKHERFTDPRGREIPCSTTEAVFASAKFAVLSEDVLDRYERTFVRRAKLKATEDGPPGVNGQPLWRIGEFVLAISDGPMGAGGAPKWRAGEPIFYEVTLLDILAERVLAEQSLSTAERRGLPGARVVAG